jgi:hypothetical protein
MCRLDLDRRQCAWSLAGVDDGDRELGSHDPALDHRDVVVGECLDHRPGKIVGVFDDRHTLRRPTRSRLHDEVTLERGAHDAKDARGTELAECLVREHDRVRNRQPGARGERSRHGLRPGPARSGTGRADRRYAERAKQVEQRPVFAARTMQRWEHHVGPFLGEEGKQCGVGVAQHDPMPGCGQGVGHATTRAERNVALVRDAARQHDDVQATGIRHDQGFSTT